MTVYELVKFKCLSQQNQVAKPLKGSVAMQSQQIDHEDLLFAHFIIADITSGLKIVSLQTLHILYTCYMV